MSKTTNALILRLAELSPLELQSYYTFHFDEIIFENITNRARELFSEAMVSGNQPLAAKLEDLIEATLLFEPAQRHPQDVSMPQLVELGFS